MSKPGNNQVVDHAEGKKQDLWKALLQGLFLFADSDKTFEPNKKDKYDRTVLAAYLWGLDLTKALSNENK